MGCKRTPKLYRLKFQDGDYAGLEITLRSLTIGQMRRLKAATDGDSFDPMVELLAESLVEWNREDEHGEPLPPTLDSLDAEDPDFVNAIVAQWTEAIAGVPAPLDGTSNDGATSPVESIPTELLSPSLAS